MKITDGQTLITKGHLINLIKLLKYLTYLKYFILKLENPVNNQNKILTSRSAEKNYQPQTLLINVANHYFIILTISERRNKR